MTRVDVSPRRAVLFLAACAGALIPWTVGLALALPSSYTAGNWTVTWTGFDIGLASCFAVTAWALRAKRPIALPAAIATTVLLLCDAWFDLLTAHVGVCLLVSAVTAVFGELPIAAVMARISARLLRANAPRPETSAASPYLRMRAQPIPGPLGRSTAQPRVLDELA